METVPDHVLTFDQPVILVGASPVPVDSVLSLLPAAWPLIAADGGADMLLDLGRRPDMVIGDMDSLVHATRCRLQSRSSISQGRMILITILIKLLI